MPSFHKNSETEAQRSYSHDTLNYKTEREREHARNSFGLLTQSYCEQKKP